ncbi:RNA-binding family protein with RRM/RBD/RNP motifs [Prunus dulcis]|uniref:RNA-binding family protein with RRM/RBD/RNP motifs n=1 Tax=Prunus dulcis TaxID=3755 RepID=A0A4Y1R0S5_PRUDU|nr:RNA-binding family protein with RRM/RBD/RNP motifs [Prunus dulcis]
MRPVFVGNFEYETRQSELERLFSKHGRVDRVDMKSGFAFVYFEDERDAEDAIQNLDNKPFGYDRRRLSVEWAKGERGRHHDGSKSVANQRPTKTLFVINFDPLRTKVRDIERHFEPYGKVLHVRIRRNFAFVQFDTQEEATKALEATHARSADKRRQNFIICSKILDRVVSVEYALRDDGERGDRYHDSPKRGSYGRHGDSPYARSPSPVYHRRPSPDYGRPVVQHMTGTTVQCITGTGVLITEGTRVLNMADTAVARLFEDQEPELLQFKNIKCLRTFEFLDQELSQAMSQHLPSSQDSASPSGYKTQSH